ncbi:Integrase catalytic domain-containing protein, partial [Aphis craccivora]
FYTSSNISTFQIPEPAINLQSTLYLPTGLSTGHHRRSNLTRSDTCRQPPAHTRLHASPPARCAAVAHCLVLRAGYCFREDDPKTVLTRARTKRDIILKTIKRMHVTALEARSDVGKVPALISHADDLNNLVEQFQHHQNVVIDALLCLNRFAEFELDDDPLFTSMDSMRLEIKTILAGVVSTSVSENKDSPSSSIASAPQLFIPLPKIDLPTFDGNLLEWRSFRDIFVSLVHDNSSIGDAQRFHFLMASLKGDALNVIKSIPLSATNYALAWEAVSDRFDNKRLLASAHLDKLFGFKPIERESLPALLSFVNTFKENVSLIKSLGVNDLSSFLLFHMGSRVLDAYTIQLFESSISPSTIPTFDELLNFVQQRCRVLENIKKPSQPETVVKPRGKYNARNKTDEPRKSVFTATTSTSVKSKSKGCLSCDKADHNIYRCPKFNGMTVEKRREFVAARRLCFACMSPSHMINACSSTGGCRSCNSKRHHSLLHFNNDQSLAAGKSTQSTSSSSSSGPSTEKSSAFSGAASTNSTVVLGTAIVIMKDAWDQVHSVRVLLDSGSQISAMTSDCFARLGLSKRRFKADIVGLAQSPVSHAQGVTTCQFSSHFDPHLFPAVDLVILTHITAAMPSERLPASVRSKYQHLCLADNKFDVPSRIDVLFGADILPSLVRPHAGVEHHPGLPSALDTQLGWIIFGSFSTASTSPLVTLTSTVDSSIGDLMQSFWAVEEPSAPVSPTTEDQWCEEYFRRSTFRDSSGRFCVALPFRDLFVRAVDDQTSPNHSLGDSRSTALKRFYNLEKRLAKDFELYVAYRKFMSTYRTLGHMVPAPQPGKYFIPHHAVLKADGDMSKIRVVFDASSVSSSGRSLNDVLCTGPKLQVDLRDILLRCRLHKYILTADIVKMYRQILIRPEDRVFQHIFWRDSPTDDLQEFQLCTVTYGLNCAPYLAIRCLHELDAQDGSRFPLAAGVLTQATYVDDIVIGSDTEEQLLRRKNDIVGLLRGGAFELSKWTSNSALVLESLCSEDRVNSVSFDPRDEHSVKVLGLHWNTGTDSFAYHTSTQQTPSTKRQVLSVIARLFDPIGALGPLLLWAKCFMQSLWGSKLEWDEPITDELLSIWRQFYTELIDGFDLAIPRFIPVACQQDIQLLGFADASIKGYAAIIYLRSVDAAGKILIRFITCKTKVAPIKTASSDDSLSIPRLELCGALLLAQTLHYVHYVLSSEISITCLRAWTDSSIVLSWLTSDQKHFKIFITNRIAKIHQLVPDCRWNHVSTAENPADPASRGLLPKATMSSDIYWNGPEFLRLPEEQWPAPKFVPLSPAQLPETKPNVTLTLTAAVSPSPLELFNRFSSLSRMQRVLSFVFRYLSRLRRRPVCSGPLMFSEREAALFAVVRQTQRYHFSDLHNMLKKQSTISPPSLAQLAPYVDEKGIIRVGGRLRFSDISHDAKHPILLPRSSHLTDLIIRHYHLSFLHGGSKLILSMLNQKYWILSARAAVRRVIFACVPCTRHRAVRPQPIMANLPSYRVQPHRPFSHVGMDYGGPFLVKEHRRRNARSVKVYLALFVCMSVKAVHLEIVTDLSTDAFLAALDRFVARRGIPSNIYSDCGTNYVGAARQLKELFRDTKVQDQLSSRLTCTWHFNPPAAPHFGGIWEAGIKSVKFHLKHVIGQQVLTYEEFLTLTTRIEGILNSRPITPMSSDPHDLSALTPGHFLIGQPLQAVPEPDITDVQINRLNRWQLIRQCHQSYWKRWSREYLSTLQGRQKWLKTTPNLTIGDMVIVEAPSRPPTEWRLGRVTDVHPGSDNVVRVVSVRTLDGVYKRPVVKLVRLPVEP